MEAHKNMNVVWHSSNTVKCTIPCFHIGVDIRVKDSLIVLTDSTQAILCPYDDVVTYACITHRCKVRHFFLIIMLSMSVKRI